MLINKYIKSRKYILIMLFIILILIVLTVKRKNILSGHNTFKSSLRVELKKSNLNLVSVQNKKTSYKLDYNNFFFIAEIHGLKEVFSASSRVTKTQEIIDLKNIEQLTDTPLTDETIMYSDDNLFIYKTSFKNIETISVISNNKITYLVFKDKSIDSLDYKEKYLIINKKRYLIDNLKTNDDFKVYIESLKDNKNNYLDSLKEMLIKENWKNDFKYIEFLGKSKDEKLPFKYLKAKIPLKSSFEIYFFDKRDYFIDIVDSGGRKHSKTGVFFRKSKLKDKNIYIDSEIKGGFSRKAKLIRPIITNYSTLLVDGKNHIKYGFLKSNNLKDKMVLQFGYPLVYKNRKDVEIENLKNNLKDSAKKDKVRTGICIKDNLIGYFNLVGNRNLLIDYLYLVDCDYAVETNSTGISSTPILNNNPQIMLKPKNKISTNMKFTNDKFLSKYENKEVKIYEIPCGDLNLSFKHGKSDPLTNKLINIEAPVNTVALTIGTIDPITPDGLIINNETFYEINNKDAFMISESACKFVTKKNKEKIFFYKEGFLAIKNGENYDVKNKKYLNITLGIGVRDNIVLLYQFKKATNYKDILRYAKDTDVKNLLIFENYGGILDEEAGKLLLNSLKNGREIYEIE